VPPDDPRALRRALASLIEDPARRRALAGRAHHRASTYTLGLMGKRYAEVYRDLAAERRTELPISA